MAAGDDREELAGYVEVWWRAVADLVALLEALLESLPDDAWRTPTDLPGWDVLACAAHVAHLESVLAGGPAETADIGPADHITGPMGQYTEIGVVNRRAATPAAVTAEIRDATGRRHASLLADPPTDGAADPVPTFPGVPWTWRTLLRNRPLDVWMHEQDIRRALGRPGNLDSPAAAHTAAYLAEGLGYVLAKRVGAPPGTTLVVDLDGTGVLGFAVGDDGRGRRLPEPPADPTVALRLDRESLVVLAGGRRAPDPGRVDLTGDAALGALLIERMATTP